ncbi:WEB family protein At4g27595, chloroplastic [Drosophila elegans]|uniref:WEB family protein At4g27595, chloroplastic n=1 Tax=Drosophila elegans TaxID=30023 RepID=UPI0007E8A42D|nr:WEB family protein At4g27595, chloroplastic [Drosophila elegans]
MYGEEKDICNCPCEKSSLSQTNASENQQQMMLARPELWTQQKSEASMKVFTTVMLHTWRQRRKEVRQLQDEVQSLQTSYMKSKNQLHVYGTLMRVEQKRNSELQLQLKQSTMNIDKVRTSCKSLASTVRNLKKEKIQLQTDLEKGKQEFDELEEVSGQNKKLLFTARLEQSNLQKLLTDEQRINQNLHQENEQLVKEVVLAEGREAKYRQVRDWYHRQLGLKEERIAVLRENIAVLEERLQAVGEQLEELEQLRVSAQHMTDQITELRQEINQSRTSFFSVLGEPSSRFNFSHLKNDVFAPFQRSQMWINFRRYSSNVMYLFCLYFLPAMPVSYHRKK